MALPALLSHCEQLTHNERMKYLIQLGREASTNAAAKSLVEELHNGDLYEQLLGLQTCHGSRDVAPLLAALQSSSAILRKRAANYLVVLGSDEDVVGALQVLYGQVHKSLLKRLRRRRRFSAIDAYLAALEASDDFEDQEVFETFLPLASAGMIRLHLPELLDTLDQGVLAQLPLYHPVLIFTIVRDRIKQDGWVDKRFLSIINTLLRRSRPVGACGPAFWELVMEVVRILPRSVALSDLELKELIVRRPQDIAQLVIEKNEDEFPSFSRVFSKLDTEQLLALQKLNQKTVATHQFTTLTAEQRLAVYNFMGSKWRQPDDILALTIFYGLPAKERVEEARRNIALPAFETKPNGRIPYIAALPWEEAIPLQRPFISSNDANIRASAITKQVEAAGDQPEHLGDALTLLLPRGREQDPVRQQFLSALSELPAEKWETAHLGPLTKIIRDTLNAVDFSFYSAQAILKLATRLLPFHTTWASEQLALIIGESHKIPSEIKLKKLQQPEIMKVLSHDLLPVLQNLQEQDKDHELILLAEVLKASLDYFPAFVDMIEEMLMQTKSTYHATRILGLWSTYRPQRLESLIPRLLDSDPSWITLHFVDDYVQKHSLTAYSDLESLKGRFGTVTFSWESRKKKQNVHFPWQKTRQQQEAEKVQHVATITDEKKSASDWQLAISELASLCFVSCDALITSASDPRPVVRDTSLRALGRLDAAQGIPTLITALSDPSRSRVAIYSLRSALTSMPAAAALSILRATPLTQVTVAKEVIRLSGALQTDAAYAFLVSLDASTDNNKPPLHRDALIALLAVVAPLLQTPNSTHYAGAKAVFERAARHADASVPTAVVARLPTDLALPHHLPFWTPLLLSLLSHPSAPVRLVALARCTRTYTDSVDSPILYAAVSPLLHSAIPNEPLAAAAALIRVYGCNDPALLEQLFTPFLSDVQFLAQLAATYCSVARGDRIAFQHSTERLLGVLSSSRNTLSLRLTILFDVVPRRILTKHVLDVVEQLHADALVKAEGLVQGLVARGDLGEGWKEAVQWLEGLEGLLGGSEDGRGRRLGLALLVGVAGRKGWSGGRKGRLEAYRADEEEMVAEAAAFVVLPKRVEE